MAKTDLTEKEIDELYCRRSWARDYARDESVKRSHQRARRNKKHFVGRIRYDAKTRAMHVASRYVGRFFPVPEVD